MIEKPPAFQWYPKDILTSQRVAMMTLAEEGAYRRALDFCWLNGHLPSELKDLARVIGKGCNIKIASIVKAMFIDNGDKLTHDRLDKERDKQERWREKTKLAGKKSAELRQLKSNVSSNLVETKQQHDQLENSTNKNPTLQSSSSSSSSTAVKENTKGIDATASPPEKKEGKPKKEKLVEKPTPLYASCMVVYATWFENKFGLKPKIDGGQGKALKDLIAWFKSQAKPKQGENEVTDERVVQSFQMVFDNWDKLEAFYQQKTKLTEISSNIQNLIVQIKNPNPKQNGNHLSKNGHNFGAINSAADAILAEAASKNTG